VEERFLLDRIALHAADIAPGHVQPPVADEPDLADTGRSFRDRTGMAARMTAEAILRQGLDQLGCRIRRSNLEHFGQGGHYQTVDGKLRSVNSFKTVAIIGASSNRGKFGNKALRAFANKGYTVFPINPAEVEVEGHKAYRSVLDVPGTVDLATIYVPGRVGTLVLDEIAKKGIPEVWLNPGADDPAVVEKARSLGLETVRHCSIIAIGDSPSRY
jgi:predicted CoA-binding protein